MTGRDAPALLLGGSVNALSAARSLAARGVEVHAVGDGLGASPVARSRAIASWSAPDTDDVGSWWLELLGHRPPSAVIPCSDDAVELIARHRQTIEGFGHRCPPGNDAMLLDMLDKEATAATAARAGVAAPRVRAVGTIEELRAATEEFGFPCGVKPRHSHRFTRSHAGLKGVTLLGPRDVDVLAAPLVAGTGDVLVTEIVPGHDPVFSSYNTYLDEDGTHLFEITKQKLRQYPIDFGRGTAHRTVHLPDVMALGRAFLRSAGLVGFGNVEFRVDARDDELKLIECNVRLTAANALLTAAGCDVAWVVFRRTTGQVVEATDGFREGLMMLHPVRDIRAAQAYRRTGDSAADVSVRAVLDEHRGPRCHPVWSRQDPVPLLGELWRTVRSTPNRLRR